MVINVAVWTAYSLAMSWVMHEPRVRKLSLVCGTELTKLVLALLYYTFLDERGRTSRGGPLQRLRTLAKGRGALFCLVPAAIYMVNNTLTFANLQIFDPATYRVLINVRILLTGVLMQVIFQKRLSGKKWGALCILFVGCVVGKLGGGTLKGVASVGLLGWLTLFGQGLCSSCGNVYFAWLLKRKERSPSSDGSSSSADGSAAESSDNGAAAQEPTSMWAKNCYLYFFGVVINIGVTVAYRHDAPFDGEFLAALTSNYMVATTIVLGAVGGIFISLLLKHLDSAMKEMLGGIELFTCALAQWPLMGISLRPALVVSIVIVSVAIKLYSNAEGSEEQTKKRAEGSSPPTTSSPGADDTEAGGVLLSPLEHSSEEDGNN
jgi:drug/metabolite transporter (DMT)-like permease